MNHFLNQYLTPLLTTLSENTHWYFTIMLLVAIYIFINYILSKKMKKQIKLRKEIINKIKDLKKSYEIENDRTNNFMRKKVESLFKNINKVLDLSNIEGKNDKKIEKVNHFKEASVKTLRENQLFHTFSMRQEIENEKLDEINEKARKIIKDKKAKPYLIILLFIFKLLTFFIFLLYLNEIDTVSYSVIVPVCNVIISFLTYVTRKKTWIFILILPVSFYVYTNMSGALNLFFMYYFLYKLVKGKIKK